MIWAAFLMYAWAGVTIGRLCYEFDVFAEEEDPHPFDGRRREIRLCWIVGVWWFLILPRALWVHVREPR